MTCWITLYPCHGNVSWHEYDALGYGTPPAPCRAFEAVAERGR